MGTTDRFGAWGNVLWSGYSNNYEDQAYKLGKTYIKSTRLDNSKDNKMNPQWKKASRMGKIKFWIDLQMLEVGGGKKLANYKKAWWLQQRAWMTCIKPWKKNNNEY